MAGFDFPEQRFYEGEQHLWARIDPDERVIVGIDRLGLEALGELAYVSFHPVGTRLARGEPFGTLEAAKMTTEVMAPVSGTVVERNDEVLRDPLLVNRDPYDSGWLVALEPADWKNESDLLVTGDAITDWAAREVERYRAEGWID